MRITTTIKSFIAAGLAVFVLSGCSSSSTATGLGLGVSGFWSGTLLQGNSAFTNFTMSLSQTASDADDPFAPSEITGTFNSSDNCIGGGSISGTLNANNINFTVDTPNGVLSMSGTAGNSTMSGSWNNQGEIAGEGEDASPTSCNFGGTWSAGR